MQGERRLSHQTNVDIQPRRRTAVPHKRQAHEGDKKGGLTSPQPTPCKNTTGRVSNSSVVVAASADGRPNPEVALMLEPGPDAGCRTQNVKP